MDNGHQHAEPDLASPTAPSYPETKTQPAVPFPATPHPPTPPEPILSSWGPFERLTPVARGGFGAVYRAWDPRLQRDVALKLLRPKAEAIDPGMLLDEARMMARVRHSNVVPVYGVEAHDGRIGFWSEFIHGKTLAALIAAQGPMGPRECAVTAVEICRALGAVHAAGLLHQDIKAENVLREQGGRILLMDFGLSRLSGHGKTGAGTPAYMAPEMWNGAPPSPATDIYALGVLLYFLTTGRFPYPEHSVDELRQAISKGRPTRLLDARPDLPAPLVQIIERACHADPAQRHATPGILAAELSTFLESPSPASAPPPKPSRRRWILAACAAPALAAALYFSFRHPSPTTQAPDHFLEARQLLARYDQPGNTDRAIALLNTIIETNPDFALAHALRAQANAIRYVTTTRKEVLDSALEDANRALQLNQNLSSVYVTLGNLHMRTSKRDLAAEELQRAISLDPTNAAAHRTMGNLLDQLGRANESRQSLQRAIDLDPDDWQNYHALGNSNVRRGDYRQAIQAYDQALQLAPDNPLLLNNLGYCHLQIEDYPKAVEPLQRAVAITPRYLSYANLGLALKLQGRLPEAAGMLQKAVEINPTHYGAWGDLAAVYQWTPGMQAKAAELYRKAASLAENARALDPKNARLLAYLADYKATLGEKPEAVRLARQALALAPGDVEVLFIAGEAFELSGDRAQAIPHMKQALQLGFPKAHLERSPELAALRNDPRFRNWKPKPNTH